MKITINTFGTRGDIQPYIALGVGLQRAGHAVRIFSHQLYESFVREHGLDFFPLDIDPQQVLLNQAIAELGSNMVRIHRWLEQHFTPVLADAFRTTLQANQGADLMLNSGLAFTGWHVAEKLEIPAAAAYLWPAIPSRHIPATLGPRLPEWLPWQGWIHYAVTKFSNQMFFNLLRAGVNQCRVEILGLPPLTVADYWRMDAPHSPQTFLYGYSPAVLPKPPDWGANQHVCGYWFLEAAAGYQPDAALQDFLERGPPPVYFGFGSMVEHEQEELVGMVVQALARTGQRGILSRGWSEFEPAALPDTVLAVEAVPHDWLFPRMAAVVHHGGAGTTAAGLRAGVPAFIVPAFGDQFFWGERVYELGAGVRPVPRQQLTSGKLAQAIEQLVQEAGLRQQAGELSQRIRAEDGIGKAVELIEGFRVGKV